MKKYDIKSMNLYKSTNRFIISYKNLKHKLNRQPSISELSVFDHLHYNGTISVDSAIKNLNINNLSKVLDIGSGIGIGTGITFCKMSQQYLTRNYYFIYMHIYNNNFW